MLSRVDFRTKVQGIYRYLWKEIVFTALYSGLIYYLYEHHELTFLSSFGFLPVGFFGTVLSVFLAFRNNSAYDRWWEARRLWGEMVNSSRSFAMQLTAVVPPEYSDIKRRMIQRHLAFINQVRMQLRGEPDSLQRNPYLCELERSVLANVPNPAAEITRIQTRDIWELVEKKVISDYQQVMLLGTLTVFYNVQGACERIKNTPFPRQSDEFIRILLWILMLLLPIYLLSLFSTDLTKMLVIPFAVVIVAVIGFANTVGQTLEDPFENRVHDIPMSTICEKIAKDLLVEEKGAEQRVQINVAEGDAVIW
jgi:putative membrane protein